MAAVTVSYADWYAWAQNYESTLAGVADTNQSLIDAYDEAYETMHNFRPFMELTTFRLLVYRFAMHLLIVSSGAVSEPILVALYAKYKVASFSGILTSAGSGPTSSSKMIPARLQDGDAQTMSLFSTPYGKPVEEALEALRNVVVTA